MRPLYQLIVAAVLAANIPAFAENGSSASMGETGNALSQRDEAFVQKAGHAGSEEVAAARLALNNSQNDQVKAFAQQMLDDHTAANTKLEEIATPKGKTPPDEPNHAQAAVLKKLESLTGNDFDTAYIADQVKAHNAAVSLFSREAKQGKNTELKQFAAETLPTLQQHQSHIKQLAQSKN